MMSIQEILAAASPAYSNTGKLSSGTTETILAFPTAKAAQEVARQLREAGAETRLWRTAYGEYMIRAMYRA